MLRYHGREQARTDPAAGARADRRPRRRRGDPVRATALERPRHLAADAARRGRGPRPRRVSCPPARERHVRQPPEDRAATHADLVQRGHAPPGHGAELAHAPAPGNPRGRRPRAGAERLAGHEGRPHPAPPSRRRRDDGDRDAARAAALRPRPDARAARGRLLLRAARAPLRRRDRLGRPDDRTDRDRRGGVGAPRRPAALAGLPLRADDPRRRGPDRRVRALRLPRRPVPARRRALAAARTRASAGRDRVRRRRARRRGMTPRAGCSYFGVRILRHVRRDLEDIAARGYTDVLHTFSENDLAYYRGTMADIVAASHDLGLAVQMAPWGLGRTFGGEAESRFVTMRPDACQLLDDGRRVATGCLNNETYRAFCRRWDDAAIQAGADRVFWDEPHWTVPEHVGIDDEERWACRCEVCLRLYEELRGEKMPAELTPGVLAFREASTADFLRDLLAHVAARGGRSTICLLPLIEGPHGVSDWDAVASLPGLDTLATDPYWKNFDESAGSFVGRFARLVAETARRHGGGAQLWVPSFGLTREDVPDLEAAIESARAAGIDDLWTWAYEACAHMTHLATPDSPLVWEAVTRALTQRGPVTEAARVELRDLDLRPTLELVRVINAEDETVAEAVAHAAPQLAAAIDAIVERLRAGGRVIYVGAGSSGRLAALDAAECGPTF